MYHFKVDADNISEDEFIKYVGWLKYSLSKTGQWQTT